MQKLYWILATAVAVLIVCAIYSANTGSSMPAMHLLRSIAYGDKVAHFLLFGFFSFLLNMALSTKRFKFGRFSVYRGTVLVGLLALLEELSQRFISNRTFEYFDLLADFAGIFFFAVLTALYARESIACCSRSRL